MVGERTLTPKQKEVAHCIASGMTQREAAATVKGISQVTVHNWLRSPLMRQYISDLHCAEIDRAYSLAINSMLKRLQDKNPWVRADAEKEAFALKHRIEDVARGSQEINVILPTQTYLPDGEEEDEEDGIEVGEGTVIEAEGTVG